jgi:single-stranded-DNA-specific exonuclease
MEGYWDYIQVNYDNINKIATKLRLPFVISRILVNRNYDTIEKARKFLYPDLSDLHDPFLMKDMEITVDRLLLAVRTKEKICIYGDYDVDGVTSIIILKDILQRLGANVTFTIPHRLDEGYGLNMNRLQEIVNKRDNSLLVTVDCGTTSIEEVDYARKSGLDIIITDHHEEAAERPPALSILNPKLSDCPYPHKELAGVGVIFKLAQAIAIKAKIDLPLLTYLSFAAIGTIADIVPLIDENRIIASHGLLNLAETENMGLKTIMAELKLDNRMLQASDISFRLAPRINALGRLGNVEQAVDLFFTTNRAYARDIVMEMNRLNSKRQKLESEIYDQAEEKIESSPEICESPVIIVTGESWHLGVIGIVASRLTNKYYKPAIVISINDDLGKASGRSIPEFDLKGAIDQESDVLESYGGHKMAVGFQIKKDYIPDFSRRVNNRVKKILDGHMFVRQNKIDAEITLANIDRELLKYIEMLKPFGHSNPRPIFRTRGVKLAGKPHLLKDKHIKMKLIQQQNQIDCICWKKSEWIEDIFKAESLDIIFNINKNYWQGVEEIQLEIHDFTAHQS